MASKAQECSESSVCTASPSESSRWREFEQDKSSICTASLSASTRSREFEQDDKSSICTASPSPCPRGREFDQVSKSSLCTTNPSRSPELREIEAARGKKRCASLESTDTAQYKKPKEDLRPLQNPQSHEKPKLKVQTRSDIIRSHLQSLMSHSNPENKYEPREVIGKGAFGAVWRGSTRDTRKEVAIKVQHLSPENIRSRLVSEVSIMKQLDHVNVSQYIDGYLFNDQVWIVMDYVEGLSVAKITDYNKFSGAKMPTRFISAILKGVLEALKYLHGMDIIHRDVKGENILVATNGYVKLVDYGLSIKEGHCIKPCGTLRFMAPEVFQGIPYTTAIDIWSLGMTAVQMLNNDHPYREVCSTDGLKENIINNIMPAINSEAPFPHALKHFIKSCLKREPSQRYTAAGLRPHALFSFFQASPTDIGDTIISIQEHIYDIE